MLNGIGLIGMFTGSITTYFVKGAKRQNPAVTFIIGELYRYEELNIMERKRLLFFFSRLK